MPSGGGGEGESLAESELASEKDYTSLGCNRQSLLGVHLIGNMS